MFKMSVITSMSAMGLLMSAPAQAAKLELGLEAVMDLEDRLIHPILDECLPQAVSV